ncbi:MAG: glutamyl-tRNA reductase, partial [Promethearchaeota archaeon]
SISIDYKNPPLGFPDRFALTKSDMSDLHKLFLKQKNIDAVIIIQTCNRFEIYFTDNSEDEGKLQAIGVLLRRFGEDIEEFLSLKTYLDTLNHLFRVVCSLESLVVGENQILAQCKEAYYYSTDNGFTDKVLELVFEKALRIGKLVRSRTQISRGKVSISSIAVDMINNVCPLSDKKILLIGNGKMASLIAEYLKDFEISSLTVIGRTPERVFKFCKLFNAQAADISYLPDILESVDIVLSATSAPKVLIKRKQVKKVMSFRKHPIYFMDIAVPRDIDPSASKINNVHIYSYTDLKEIANKNLRARMSEICKVEAIIKRENESFMKKLRQLHVSRYFTNLNKYTESIRNKELEKAICMLGGVYEPKIKQILEGLSKSLMKKLMHNFLLQVRENPLDERELEKFTKLFIGSTDSSSNQS